MNHRNKIINYLRPILAGYNYDQKGMQDVAIKHMHRALRDFYSIYEKGLRLAGSTIRVRIKFRMYVGYVCSTATQFPTSEAVWRELLAHITENKKEKYQDNPVLTKEYEKLERRCKEEIDDAITTHPIWDSADYNRVMLSFNTMTHLAHVGPNLPEPTQEHTQNWVKVDPWLLPRGKSILVDYLWDIPHNPPEHRRHAHHFFDEIASRNADYPKLLRELEEI